MKLHFDFSTFVKLRTEALDRSRQSQMVQLRRMKLVREPVNLRCYFLCLCLKPLDIASQTDRFLDFLSNCSNSTDKTASR